MSFGFSLLETYRGGHVEMNENNQACKVQDVTSIHYLYQPNLGMQYKYVNLQTLEAHYWNKQINKTMNDVCREDTPLLVLLFTSH